MLNKFKRIRLYFRRKIKANKDINYYLNADYEIHPYFEAGRIALVYGISGTLWILFSDRLLSKIISDIEIYKKWAMYKGWAYVVITMLLIYLLVAERLVLFEKAIEKIYDNFNKLSHTNKELEIHRNALVASEQRYKSLVYHDILTGLPNRLLFEIKVAQLINEKETTNKKFALIYMDIDNFKNINNTMGRDTGDLLLQYVANLLEGQVKEPHLVSRVGGDEFAAIISNINGRENATNKVQDLLKVLRQPWIFEEKKIFISFSMGIAMYPEDGNNLAVLLKRADTAMYTVKKNTKDNYCFYVPKMQEQNLQQIKMIGELRQAIINEEFVLYYQPIINLKTEQLVAAEALVRWMHPTKGIIPPMAFIPLAEETGLIHEIGKCVLKTALIQKKHWQNKAYRPIKVSINISGKRVSHDIFLDEVSKLISSLNVKCDEIQFEVTETAVMEDINASTKVLQEIKNMGINIALDDFGSGYSSLTYLQNLPIDVVKLDKDFIKNISHTHKDKVMIESIIRLTHDLDLEIVAEGIETDEQLKFLKLNECNYGQGYLFSRPIPKEEMETLLLLEEK